MGDKLSKALQINGKKKKNSILSVLSQETKITVKLVVTAKQKDQKFLSKNLILIYMW